METKTTEQFYEVMTFKKKIVKLTKNPTLKKTDKENIVSEKAKNL